MKKSKELQGVLFKNNKGDNPARPDRRGTCTINGKQYDIAGWVKEDNKGDKFLSLAFTLAKETEDTQQKDDLGF